MRSIQFCFKYLENIGSWLVLLIAILVLTGCGPQIGNLRKSDGSEVKKTEFTVMTFNIRHGCGIKQWGNTSGGFFRGCKKHLEDLAATINSVPSEVVGLQEVNDGQAKALAKMTNMNYTYSSHNPGGYAGSWGNAILSKFKILDSDLIRVGSHTLAKNRSIVSATMKVNSRNIVFISVHTHDKLYTSYSVRRIMAYIDSLSGPVVLIGDFNMRPNDDRWVEEIKKTPADYERDNEEPRVSNRIFVDTAEEVDTPSAKEARFEGTWAAPYNSKRIDYILVEEKYFKVLDAGLVPLKYRKSSDHFAYYSVIRAKY